MTPIGWLRVVMAAHGLPAMQARWTSVTGPGASEPSSPGHWTVMVRSSSGTFSTSRNDRSRVWSTGWSTSVASRTSISGGTTVKSTTPVASRVASLRSCMVTVAWYCPVWVGTKLAP